jgi:Virulence-associated protein E-like domain/BT4734-like, N-terminal domain
MNIRVKDILDRKVELFSNINFSSKKQSTIRDVFKNMKTSQTIKKSHSTYLKRLSDWKGLTKEEYNNSEDIIKKEKMVLKGKLPSVSFSSTYRQLTNDEKVQIITDTNKWKHKEIDKKPKMTNRQVKCLETHNGCVLIDIDKLEYNELVKTWNILKEDRHTIALFISPSMNGLKVLVSVKDDNNVHPDMNDKVGCYNWHRTFVLDHLIKYYGGKNIKIDTSCRDVGRLCFIPFLFKKEDIPSNLPTYEELFWLRDEDKSVLTFKIKPTKTQLQKLINTQSAKLALEGRDLALEELLKWCKLNGKHIFNLNGQENDVFNLWRRFAWGLYMYFEEDVVRMTYYLKAFTLISIKFKCNSSIMGFDEGEIEDRIDGLISGYSKQKTMYIKPEISIEAIKYGFEFSDDKIFADWMKYTNKSDKAILQMEEIKIYRDRRLPKHFIDWKRHKLKDEALTDTIQSTLVNKIDEMMTGNYNEAKFRLTKNDMEVFQATDRVQDLYDNMLKYADDGKEFERFVSGMTEFIETPKEIFEQIFKLWMLQSIDGHLLNNNKYNKEIYKKFKYKSNITYRDERFNKFIVVLSGGHNTRKGSFVKRLIDPFDHKHLYGTSFRWNLCDDDKRALCNYCFIFDDELKAAKKADIENIKAITGNVTFNWVEKFKEHFKDNKRMASFITTTNEEEVFNDDTGNVRFLVIKLKEKYINVDKYDFVKIWGYMYKIWLEKYSGWDYAEKIDFDKILENSEDHRFKGNLELLIEEKLEQSLTTEMTYPDLIEYFRKYHDIKTTRHQLSKYLRKTKYGTKQYRKDGKKWTVIMCKIKSEPEIGKIIDESEKEYDKLLDLLLDMKDPKERKKLTEQLKKINR